MNNQILFFDSGPIISLVMSRLTWLLPQLKHHFGGKFYITPAVKRELIERPLQIKRFQFEALQVMKLLREGILELYQDIPLQKVKELERLADNSFRIKKKSLDIAQSGEMESIASALKEKAALVMDERTLRLFIENSKEMEKLLEIRFQKDITPDFSKMKQFSQPLKGIKIIRSIELVAVAYQLGLLNDYLPQLKDGKKVLLDAVLWSTKFNGCAVTSKEIEEIKKYLLKR